MQKLGIDPTLMTVQIVNFLLLLFLLRAFLYKPILKKIKDRRLKLEAIEKEGERVDKEKLDLEGKRAALIQMALKEKEFILEEANRQAGEERRKIIEKANLAARDLLKIVGLQIEREREMARKEIDEKVIKLSLAITRKVIKRLVIGKIRQRSVGLAIKELGRMKLSNEIN